MCMSSDVFLAEINKSRLLLRPLLVMLLPDTRKIHEQKSSMKNVALKIVFVSN